MAIDIVRGNMTNLIASKELINSLRSYSEKNHIEGTLYMGYPLLASIESKVTVDALFASKTFGLIVFIFTENSSIGDIKEKQGELYFQLINNLTQYPSLRDGKKLAIEPKVISICTEKLNFNDNDYIITDIDNLIATLESLEEFNEKYYYLLIEALQKVTNIKPIKKRENVKRNNSKGNKIKEIESEIRNLDNWQKKAALEMVDGPQRIRGLAGTGKTIVIALKVAYMHTQWPEWDIVVTYYTRSLWQQYRDLINRFVYEFSRNDPDWEKIHLYHSWGSFTEKGLYSEIAKSININPTSYSNAKIKHGRNNAFKGICDDLLKFIPKNHKPQYDAILIDEAQDLPASFFRLIYSCTKEPKRIIWAYDELQNLNTSSMPSIEEMFGTNEEGKPLVELKNEPDQAMQDIILPVCYRNPPWILALAHSLGFGIYRNELVQHFEGIELWKDIGYIVEKGSLNYGKNVTLTRRKDATPDYFFELLTPIDVINTIKFNNMDEQFSWVANQIKNDIYEQELDPDDILVIFPDVIMAQSQYQKFTKHLAQHGISSMLTGVTHERDIFKISGFITCSAIYRAKGNEAPMVYFLNADYCNSGLELIKLRNTLFTGITRSQAWVRLCGVGDEMENIITEVNQFIDNDYKLSFKIPTKKEMGKMSIINRERTEIENKEIEQAQKGVKILLELAKKGEINSSQIPEFSSLMQLFLENNLEDKDEDD